MTDTGYPAQLLVGVTSTRVCALGAPARALHRTILEAFAATGRAPDPATLPIPAGHDRQVLLREMHDRDVVRLDSHGGIRAAYPFSATPTAHQVALAGGPTVWAMCAVDALGIAGMLDTDVTITSSDPSSGEPIRVAVRGGQASWSPDSTVVVTGWDSSAGNCCGDAEVAAAADRCCHVMNFFASPAAAHAWLDTHPTVSGVVLTQQQALRLAVDIFGHLLDP
jgi:hypothetical protein